MPIFYYLISYDFIPYSIKAYNSVPFFPEISQACISVYCCSIAITIIYQILKKFNSFTVYFLLSICSSLLCKLSFIACVSIYTAGEML